MTTEDTTSLATSPASTGGYRRLTMTPARWAAILEAGRKGGLRAAQLAWAAGRPAQADGRPAGERGLDDILKREPYASEWAAAENEFLANLESVLHQLATVPELSATTIVDPKSGKTMSRPDAKTMAWCALHILRRHDPAWRERKALSVDGQVQHAHNHQLAATGALTITTDDLKILESEDPQAADMLWTLLDRLHHIANRRPVIPTAPEESR